MGTPPTKARTAQGQKTVINIDSPEVSLDNSLVTGQLSEIIDVKVPEGMMYFFPTGEPLEFFLMVTETFTTNTTASDLETFSLANDFVDCPSLRQETGSGDDPTPTVGGIQDLVVYKGGTRQLPDSVDYSANTFDYQDGATASTLTVYYVLQDSALLQGRAYNEPQENYIRVFNQSVRTLHNIETYSRKEKIGFETPFMLEAKEHLIFYIKSGVDFSGWNDADSFSWFELPVIKQRV